MNKIDKMTSEGFGKKVFLLGKDAKGIRYWLEEPTWDCGWYWGCGYVETYYNNASPKRARDTDSHQHFNGLFLKHNRNGHVYNEAWEDLFTDSVLEEKELWTLMELMKSMYAFQNMAEVVGRGGCHVTTNPCKELIENKEQAKHINEVILPGIFKEIEKLLSPGIMN